MYRKIISQDSLDLVTLDEVKSQCRVFNDFEDEYLESLIEPFSDLAQSYTNRMLSEGVAVVVVEKYCPTIQLPFGEVTEVTEVLLDDDDVTSEDFTFEPITQKIKISVPFCKVKITFNAGYETLPKVVRQSILMAISTAFNNRDDIVIGQSVDKLPMTSLVLLDRVRLHAS